MESPSTPEQIKSILALPFVVLVIIPALTIYLLPDFTLFPIGDINNTTMIVSGLFLFLTGSFLFSQSIILMIKIGKGTLAPWNPAKKLVVAGIYRYIRNPMILGAIFILFAESILFRSSAILIWAFIFFLSNHIYFVYWEEPDLLNRFGDEYRVYIENVPRWLPRLKRWPPKMK